MSASVQCCRKDVSDLFWVIMVENEVPLGGASYSPVVDGAVASAEGELLQSFKGESKSRFVMNCRELRADINPKHTSRGEKIVTSGQD